MEKKQFLNVEDHELCKLMKKDDLIKGIKSPTVILPQATTSLY